MIPTAALQRRALRVGLVAFVILGNGCGDDEPASDAQEARGVPVRTTQVVASREPEMVQGAGTVMSRAEMNLAFKVPGYVGEVLVDEGDRVQAGQVLARLRSDEVDAGVRSAEAQAELASKNLARMERLFADSAITEAMLDQARDGNERAQAGLEVARFNQASAIIRAPAPGRVLRRMIEASEFAGPGVPVLRLSSANSAWIVRLGVADRQVVRLTRGDSAAVTLPALPGTTLRGRVSEISDAADPRSGTFGVEVTLDGDLGRLRSGMVAEVSIIVSDPEALAYLPSQALVDADGRDASVFVVQGSEVRRSPVQVVRIGARQVGVRAPDLEGATVVTDGAAYLRDGDRIDDRTAAVPATNN